MGLFLFLAASALACGRGASSPSPSSSSSSGFSFLTAPALACLFALPSLSGLLSFLSGSLSFLLSGLSLLCSWGGWSCVCVRVMVPVSGSAGSGSEVRRDVRGLRVLVTGSGYNYLGAVHPMCVIYSYGSLTRPHRLDLTFFLTILPDKEGRTSLLRRQVTDGNSRN